MDTYDENRDGRFEMNELAKALKIEENYLNKIINKKSIKDKHVQVRKHMSTFCPLLFTNVCEVGLNFIRCKVSET